jgi:hypothetical protein
MEAVFRTEAWGHMLLPISAENEEAVCQNMVSGCEATLAGYTTSLADDLRLMDSLEAGDTSPTAVALRIRMVRPVLSNAACELNSILIGQIVLAGGEESAGRGC